jgi:hypothetical protein
LRIWGTVPCVVLACVAQFSAQEPTLDAVLARTAEYVQKFHSQVSGIVAEEIYLQQARDTRRRTNGPSSDTKRTLKSDLLLVRPPDGERYIEFRDVFEVNGMPVRDRQDRLSKLFLTPTQASVDQIKSIVDESARHNIGGVMRNVNTPMLSLHFLQPDVQPRFRFRRRKQGTPELSAATDFPGRNPAVFNPPAGAWAIEFKETRRPTLIRTDHGDDLPAIGRYWIDPVTGAVLMSELMLRNSEVTAIIDVSYLDEPTLGFRVPQEMRERYRTPSERVDGVASYSRFRQFQVKTAESIGKPPGN